MRVRSRKSSMIRVLCLLVAIVAALQLVAFGAIDGQELADSAGKEAARLSRLPEPKPVKSFIVENKDELLEILWEEHRKEYPEGRMKALQLVSEKIGFYVNDIETDEEIIKEEAEGIAGFYNHENKLIYILDPALQERLKDEKDEEMEGRCGPERDEFYNPVLDDWFKKNGNKIVLVHEMTHAVEDQSYDLTAWMDQYKANTDAIIGIKTVVEGLAEYAENNYISPHYYSYYSDSYFHDIFKDYYGLLLYIREKEREGFVEYADESCGEFVSFSYQMTYFPYRYGAGLIDRVKENYGWDRVHNLFYDFPMSTEQILHPEKFLDPKKMDPPTFMEAPDIKTLLPEDYNFLDTDSMGEFRIYLLLKDLLFTPPEAMRISEGWDGDRYMAFYNERHEDVVFAWNTVWDSPNDAREFFNAYQQIAERKSLGEKKLATDKDTMLIDTNLDKIFARIEGNQVVVVEGLKDIDAIEKISEALFESNTHEATYDDWEVIPEWYKTESEPD